MSADRIPRTVEAHPGEKLTVVVNPGKTWEYRCNDDCCGQLRLYAGEDKPTKCGQCGSTDITVGRPGELPT